MGFVMSLAVLIVSLLGVASPAAVPMILDTDMGGGGCRDVDDVAALCMDYDGYVNMKRGMLGRLPRERSPLRDPQDSASHVRRGFLAYLLCQHIIGL